MTSSTAVRPYDGSFGLMPTGRKLRADTRRYAAARALVDTEDGLTVVDAVWRVVGPGGTCPYRKHRSADDGGEGVPRPSDAKLLDYWTRWCATVAPEETRAAAARESMRLVAAAAPAMDAFLDVATGRMEKFRTPVVDGAGNHVGDVIDAKAADVSRRGAERLLEAVQVLPRQYGSSVQVHAADGSTVNVLSVGDGLRAMRARGAARRARGAAEPQRIEVEVSDAPAPGGAVPA